MLKAYFFVALIAAMLDPLVWYFLISPDAIGLIWGDLLLGTSATVGIAAGSVLGLFIMQKITGHAPEMLRGFLVRFIGAMIAGFISVLSMYGLVAWQNGFLPDYGFNWWLATQPPGFISAFVAYWIVSLLVKPVAPLPLTISNRNNRHR